MANKKKKRQAAKKGYASNNERKLTKATADKTVRTPTKKWMDDFPDLERILNSYGLLIRRIDKDGNCLFRAMQDQLLGSNEEADEEEGHLRLRREVVEHLRANKDQYEGFIEDGQTFDSYCSS